MKNSNVSTHESSTRTIQRKVTNYLKGLGLKATSGRSKTSSGWLTNVKGVNVSKPVKISIVCHTGRSIPVMFK